MALGRRLNALRTEKDLTLEECSALCGVSRAMLSSIERGVKSPTLSTLLRIANGFELPLSQFLGADSGPADIVVMRADECLAYRDPKTGFERRILSPAHIDNGVELIHHKLPPNRSTGPLEPYSVPTEKYIVVVDGQLTVYINEKPYILNANDSIYFEVKDTYRFANEDARKACSYYMVIVRER